LEQQDWRRELSHQEAQRRHAALQAQLRTTEEELTKALRCIQGFITANQGLASQLEKAVADKQKMDTSAAGGSGRVEVADISTAVVGTQTEILHATEEGFQAAALIRKGVDRAMSKFRPVLADYRGRYDKVRSSWDADRRNCEILRQRLEELADFLQQLLNSWEANETLNLSSLRHTAPTFTCHRLFKENLREPVP
jgi:chromosome segregation ATPase